MTSRFSDKILTLAASYTLDELEQALWAKRGMDIPSALAVADAWIKAHPRKEL